MKHKNVQKQNPIMLVLAIAQVLLLLVIAIQLSGMSALGNSEVQEGAAAAPTAVAPTPSAPTPSAPSAAPVDMSQFEGNFKGDADAPVTIVEWSDFECPFCARFYSQAYQQIVSEYVDTGKVKIIYKHFPLSFHPNAQKAGEATECAALQDKDSFWDMHDMIFEKGTTGGVATFKQYAADIGLDTAEFNTCLDSGETAAIVQADMAEGANNGITGTPGFLVGGQRISGAQPYAVFQQAIEAALN
jgi:protein-disulfide isomerase